MSQLLHIHIITTSRRVATGLEVLLMASGLVSNVSLQTPEYTYHERETRSMDLIIVDNTRLGQAVLPPTAFGSSHTGTVPWCALVYSQEQYRQATESGADYVLSYGFPAESLFSILAQCLAQTQQFLPVC